MSPFRFLTACLSLLAVCGLIAAGAFARPDSQTAPGRSARPADLRAGEQALPRRLRDWRPEVHVPGERHLALHGSRGDPLQVGARPEADRHALPQLRHRAAGVAVQGRQQRRGGANGVGARRAGEHRVAAAPGCRDDRGLDGDRLTKTTWVQRLNTSGGVAPAGTCTPGAKAAVPYSTDYFFWKAARGHDSTTTDRCGGRSGSTRRFDPTPAPH